MWSLASIWPSIIGSWLSLDQRTGVNRALGDHDPAFTSASEKIATTASATISHSQPADSTDWRSAQAGAGAAASRTNRTKPQPPTANTASVSVAPAAMDAQ